MKKTQEDVRRLKEKWISDPYWKLSESEGFEEYKDELIAFEEEIKTNRDTEREKAVVRSAEKLFETAFAQAGASIGEQDLPTANTFALSSIAYSLLGITQQLDFIRMELERRQLNDT